MPRDVQRIYFHNHKSYVKRQGLSATGTRKILNLPFLEIKILKILNYWANQLQPHPGASDLTLTWGASCRTVNVRAFIIPAF